MSIAAHQTTRMDSTEDESDPLLQSDKERIGIRKVSRLITVEPLAFLYFMAIAAQMPLLQQYLYARISQEYNYVDPNTEMSNRTDNSCTYRNNSDTVYQQIQQESSMWVVLIATCSLLPSILVIVFLGSYSDRAGRKKAIIPPIVGGLISTTILILVIGFDFPLPVILVGSLCHGLSGGPGLELTSCLAYVTDLSSGKERIIRIVIIDIIFGLGNTISSISTGFLIKSLGFLYPAIIIGCIFVVSFIYSIFLPETINKDPTGKLCECKTVAKTFNIYWNDNKQKRRWKLFIILLVLFLFFAVEIGGGEIITFYFLNPPFCWASDKIGLYSGIAFLIRGTGSLITLKLLKNRIPEMAIGIIGLISNIIYFLILAVATTPQVAFTGELHNIIIY